MVCLVAPAQVNGNSKQEEMEDESNHSDAATTDENEDDKLKLRRLAGGSIIDHPPLFSPDGELLLIILKNVVQVYSTTTGGWLCDLEAASDEIVGLHYEFRSKQIVIGMTRKGDVIRWNWKTGAIESKIRPKLRTFEILSFHLVDLSSGLAAAFVTFITGPNRNIEWAVLDMASGERIDISGNLELGREPAQIDVENVHFHYVAAIQNYWLIVQNYRNGRTQRWKNSRKVKLTTVRVHPNEEMIATGDDHGRIFLWRKIYSSGEPTTNLYHWHHTPVTSFAFTMSGTGFYSGGQESVLVQWNMHQPDMKNFVPRMNAIIMHIVVGPENRKVAVCMADNGIQILDSQNNAKCMLQGFTYVYNDKTGLSKFPAGLKLNSRTNTLVLNGRVGHIQFYSTQTRRLLYNMDIVMQTPMSMEKDKVLYNIRVIQVAFHNDWMATVEEWNDQEHAPELRLKFWQYDTANQSFSLNTSVEQPHEKGVLQIEFSSKTETKNLLLATAGRDDYIKTWALEDSDNVYRKGKSWFCSGRTNYADLTLQCIGFSTEGSLIAAGFNNTLCIYKANTLALKAELTAPARFMGIVPAVEICLSDGKTKRNPQEDVAAKQKEQAEKNRIIELFKNYLENNDDTFIQEMRKKYGNKEPEIFEEPKNTMKRLRTPVKLTPDQKEFLFKKIQAEPDLSLFQKIDLYQKLNIYCSVPKAARKQLIKYIAGNILKAEVMESNLSRDANNLSSKYKFKAKYRLYQYQRRKAESDINQKLVPVMELLNLHDESQPSSNVGAEPAKSNSSSSHNGCKEAEAEMEEEPIPRMHGVNLINAYTVEHVLFGTGEQAHLIVACSEHRVLIWNILTLRFQAVLKLSTASIAMDPLTSLVALFTTNDQLFIFPPDNPMPLYHRVDVPKIYGAVWVPRRYPKSYSLNLDWQAISTLYFLTADQELMYLAADEDDDASSATTFIHEAQDVVQYSTFGTFAQKQVNSKILQPSTYASGIGVPGKAAVKSLIEMATHTMAPNHLLCANFIESLLQIQAEHKTPQPSSEGKKDHQTTNSSDSAESDDEIIVKSKQSVLDQYQKETNYYSMDKTKRLKQREKLKRILDDDIDIIF